MKDLDKWRETVNECNLAISDVYSLLSKKRDILLDNISNLCERYELPVKRIDMSKDCTVVTVYFDGNCSKHIHFPRKFLSELDMSFTVKRELDALANNVLFLEIYPFVGWE